MLNGGACILMLEYDTTIAGCHLQSGVCSANIAMLWSAVLRSCAAGAFVLHSRDAGARNERGFGVVRVEQYNRLECEVARVWKVEWFVRNEESLTVTAKQSMF